MKKNSNLLWIVAIALGWLFDFLFWKQSPGVNFAIFVVLCLAGGFFLLWRDEKRASRGSLWLIPLILFFAAVTFIRSEPLTVFLGVVFTLFLLSVLVMTFLGGRWFMYGFADYVSGFFKLLASLIARPLTFNAEVKREQAESGTVAPKRNLWPIVRGIVIALPVVAIFAALLASADVIFGHQLDAFIKFFKLENLPEYIFRLIYILIFGYLLAGTFLHAAMQSTDEKLSGEKSAASQILGFTESAIVLGSVTILFTAFVVIQFQYFFGGRSNIYIDGYTYSEYARRGFGELAAVASFSLVMILGLGAVTRRENEAQRKIFSGLSVAIVALVLVMLASAYQRLNLYEAAYGFSRLRTYTHVALIWIALLLLVVVVLEIIRRERFVAFAILVASLGFAISLSVMNVDGFIAKQNIARAVQGKHLDTGYLASLSGDATSVLVDEFKNQPLPLDTHYAVGAVLACRRDGTSRKSDDWRSFNFSRWYEVDALTKLHADLSSYSARGENSSLYEVAPSGETFSCYGYSD